MYLAYAFLMFKIVLETRLEVTSKDAIVDDKIFEKTTYFPITVCCNIDEAFYYKQLNYLNERCLILKIFRSEVKVSMHGLTTNKNTNCF